MDQPSAMNRLSDNPAARDCVGGSPRVPKSSGVATMPCPKCHSHTRFTITRAVSGFFGSVIHCASSSRPLPFSSGGNFCPPRIFRNPRGTSGPSALGSPRTDHARSRACLRSPRKLCEDKDTPRTTCGRSPGLPFRALLVGVVREFLLPSLMSSMRLSIPESSVSNSFNFARVCRIESHEPVGVRVDLRPRMRIVGALEDAVERVIIGVGDGIEFVIVAARAADGQTQNPLPRLSMVSSMVR